MEGGDSPEGLESSRTGPGRGTHQMERPRNRVARGELKMAENGTLAGTFVEPRGTILSVIARGTGQVFGAASRVVGAAMSDHAERERAGSSPLAKGDIAYLGVTADAVILFRAKRGLLKPKATDEVIATAPRAETASAGVEEGRLSSVLSIVFTDATTWTFDTPKIHLKGAREITTALAPAP